MKVLYRNFTPELVSYESGGMPMPEISIIDSLPWHVSALKANLREEDKTEVLGLGMSIQQSIWYGYKHSGYRKTAFIDGAPVAMWGTIGVLLGGKAQLWLLTSPGVYKVSPLRFARVYQSEVQNMLKTFTLLENYVDARYDAAIRLLDITGFTIGDPEPTGVDGAMYRHFWIGKN
jgi:hypothetical protein